MRNSTTSSFSPIRFPLFAAVFVDPDLVVSVTFSPAIIAVLSSATVADNFLTVSLLSVMTVSVVFFSVIIVPVGFVSVLGISLLVSFLSATTDSVILIPSSVACVNVHVLGDVYGAVVTGGGHVNIPTFLELQIRSLTEVQNRKIMHSSVSNLKKDPNKINIK